MVNQQEWAEMFGHRLMRRAITMMSLAASLLACANGSTNRYGTIDSSEKTAAVPTGSSGIIGEMKRKLSDDGWALFISGGTGQYVKDATSAAGDGGPPTTAPRYSFVVNQHVWNPCLAGDNAVQYDIAVLDLRSGTEITTFSGRTDCWFGRADGQAAQMMKGLQALYNSGPLPERVPQRLARLDEGAGRPLAGDAAAPRFATAPLVLSFPRPAERPDDIAVIIGNANYSKGHDIPDARTAYADAESMRRYAIDGLGVREGNLILLKDATGTQLSEVFGNAQDHRGKLFDWVKPGHSRVFVYYIGHGAPAGTDGRSMLVPADASASQIALSGYPLDLLFANLGKIPAESVTIVLDACFSGASPSGPVIGKALPLSITPKAPPVPPNVTVISATAGDQMANWEQDDSHALFTEYFLRGMSGEADKPPYGNGDGKVTLDELDRYLRGTMSYVARRTYGRDQIAQIVRGGR